MRDIALFDSSAGTALVDSSSLYIPPTAKQEKIATRPFPTQEEVNAVSKNNPLNGFRRTETLVDDDEEAARLTNEILARCFPSFPCLGPDFYLEMPDQELDQLVAVATQAYSALNMHAQIRATQLEASNYKGARASLALIRKEGLFRSGTFMRQELIPDLFMACPVWYFAKAKTGYEHVKGTRGQDDMVSPTLKYFCDLVPTERWSDLFLVFNPRVRQISEYQGELIPPPIVNLMARATGTFDYVAVATPHHDVAAKDWQEMSWPRMPDPYVLGFQTGLPFAFVLARFSGSGVFPLYHEMVADTIHFLRTSSDQLATSFNRYRVWYNSGRSSGDTPNTGNERLVGQIRKTLAAFDEGQVFDWLRGEDIVAGKT